MDEPSFDDPAPRSDPADRETEDDRVRRRDRVFGEVLPEQSGDDRDAPAGGRHASDRDDELRREVPPHHR